MNVVSLNDIDLLAIGNTVQIGGGIWAGNGKIYLVPLPDESLQGDYEILRMSTEEMERFLNQTDVLDIRGPGKAILRKSQRQIDQFMSWEVFERDGYRCRYCGRKAPLTVDHVILWENGGATVPDNLISACRRCNKTRGSMEYADWLGSQQYELLSEGLSKEAKEANSAVLNSLVKLRTIKQKGRTR